jgi:GNAT acetyltransferase-like protein
VAQWETFQPSQLPVGAWVMRPDQDFEKLLSDLATRLPGIALLIGVTQQDPDCLRRPMDSPRLQTLDYIKTGRITVKGSFEQYWEARGKNLKHNMKRQRSRLEKEGIKTLMEVVTTPDDIAQAIADYGQLESAGWKAQGGTAIHPDNEQGRFYRTMLENFCREGRGRVYRYRFNDRVVAVDLCIEGNASLIILKTTHDESIKTFSPAFLMRQEAFRNLFDEGRTKRIEFYGKLMDWHTKWSDEVRTMYHVNYYRWPFLSKIRRVLTNLPVL